MAKLWALLLITGSLAVSTSAGSWMRAEPGPACWYPPADVCDNCQANIVAGPFDSVTKAEDCYDMCNKKAGCEHFRWSQVYLQGKLSGTCLLLSKCDKGECSGTCVSGPKNCEDIKEPCPKLSAANTGSDKVVWDCGTPDFNPYIQDMMDGTVCTASCPAWGGNTVSHKCIGGTPGVEGAQGTPGTWGDAYYNGDESQTTKPDGITSTTNKPDQATDCTSQCADYPLWYDPDAERGAKFYCVPPVDFTNASPATPVNLPQDGECFLFCDNTLVADIFCNNGEWTDISQNPEVGISCFGPVPEKPKP